MCTLYSIHCAHSHTYGAAKFCFSIGANHILFIEAIRIDLGFPQPQAKLEHFASYPSLFGMLPLHSVISTFLFSLFYYMLCDSFLSSALLCSFNGPHRFQYYCFFCSFLPRFYLYQLSMLITLYQWHRCYHRLFYLCRKWTCTEYNRIWKHSLWKDFHKWNAWHLWHWFTRRYF